MSGTHMSKGLFILLVSIVLTFPLLNCRPRLAGGEVIRVNFASEEIPVELVQKSATWKGDRVSIAITLKGTSGDIKSIILVYVPTKDKKLYRWDGSWPAEPGKATALTHSRYGSLTGTKETTITSDIPLKERPDSVLVSVKGR